MSRLICRCGTPIPAARTGSEHCSESCEDRERQRLHTEAQRQLAEDTSHDLFAEWMTAWRQRVDREAVAAALGLNPATITRLSTDPYDDLRVRVHFIDHTHTDYDLTHDQFRAAVRYTTDAISALLINPR